MIPLEKLMNFILIYSKNVCVNRREGMDKRAPNPLGPEGRTVAPPACANMDNFIYSIRNGTINYIKWNFLYIF